MTTIKLDKKFEGKAVAVVKGKVVMSGQSITKIIREANEKYQKGKKSMAFTPLENLRKNNFISYRFQ